MDDDDIAFPGGFDVGSHLHRSGRPWTVKLLEQVQSFLLADKARFSIVKHMVDGNWHDLTSLWRVAKRHRPIGIVGVGMALNTLQEGTGLPLFDVGCPRGMTGNDVTGASGDPVDSSWKIKDEYMGIMRAVVSTLDGGGTRGNVAGLGSTLDRIHVQRLNREGMLDS